MTCNICGNDKDFDIVSTKIREGEGLIARCKVCNHIFQDINMDLNELEDYYNSIYTLTNKTLQNPDDIHQQFVEKKEVLNDILRYITPHLAQNMDILDVGAGVGAMLKLVEPYVKKLYATELNNSYIDWMNKQGIEADYGFYEKIKYNLKFDMIMSIESLEHMINPVDILSKMYQDLKHGGKVFITVPNNEEALNVFLPNDTQDAYKVFYWHKAHISYFNSITLTNLLEKCGFKNISIQYNHRYSIINFLNWYFKGKPQTNLKDAVKNTNLFSGNTSFEKQMNKLFENIDKEFRNIASQTSRGDTMIAIAEKL